jgi:predicted nucleic acid-binding protein
MRRLEAAGLRANLCRCGARVNGIDVRIASQVRAKRWSIAAGDLKHSEDMPNLSIEEGSAR